MVYLYTDFFSFKPMIVNFLRGTGRQTEKGSPVNPLRQVQMGLWLITWQSAFCPHVPGHGSAHFRLTHALRAGHSELTTHSGLQPGGEPTYSGRQEHIAWPLFTLHWLFGPHGDGLHGLVGTSCTAKTNNKRYYEAKMLISWMLECIGQSKFLRCGGMTLQNLKGSPV